ncbi:MAG: HEAT repeat domain-containing protein, partial [Planctomycetes bacterium]|nr:HEAT repeat domain-containing protein [Planctomycetota bacterium]
LGNRFEESVRVRIAQASLESRSKSGAQWFLRAMIDDSSILAHIDRRVLALTPWQAEILGSSGRALALKASESRLWRQRLGAARLLASFRDDASLDRLAELTGDGHRTVARCATSALEEWTRERCEDATSWKARLTRTRDRMEVVWSEFLVASDSGDEAKLASQIWQFSELGLLAPGMAPGLRECLNHASARIRLVTCETLRELGDAASFAAVIPLLEDPDPDVRMAALSALQGWSGHDHGYVVESWSRRLHPR